MIFMNTDISPSQESYGVSIVRILEKIDRVITAPNCTQNILWPHHNMIITLMSHECHDIQIHWAWLFVQQFVQPNDKGNIRAPHRTHDGVIKWKHLPCYWPFVRGIHRSPVNSPHKGQSHRTLMFTLIYAWTSSWINTRDAGYLRCHPTHYEVIVMCFFVRCIHRWPTDPLTKGQ